MPRGKVEAKAEVWGDRVRRWKESGLTAAQFATQEGLPRAQALSWWAHRLSRSKDSKKSPKLTLLRVEPVVTPRPSGNATCEALELHRDGYTLTVPRGFDEETLRRVLVVLEAAR